MVRSATEHHEHLVAARGHVEPPAVGGADLGGGDGTAVGVGGFGHVHE